MNLICDNVVNEAQLGHSKQRLRVSPNADMTNAVAARAMERNGFWEWLAQVPGLFEVILPHALKVCRHVDCLTARRESAGMHLLPWAPPPLRR